MSESTAPITKTYFDEQEVYAWQAKMMTKEYLDAKINELMVVRQKDILFKRTLILALEASRALSPETRAKPEALIS